jgi:hypothetical protein
MEKVYLNEASLKRVLELIKTELGKYVKSVEGKGLSTEDFTTELLNKLNSIDPTNSGIISATVTSTDDGAVISITDVNGTTEVTVLNGKDGADGKNGVDGTDGKDGYTPQKGVDYFDGKDGINGKDGYTPVKGVDYMTPEDIEEIAKQVEPPSIDESNIVHKDGDEEISGNKKFTGGIEVDQILTERQLKLNGDGVSINGGGSEVQILGIGLRVNGELVATKDDITIAIQKAILDSWSEVIEP